MERIELAEHPHERLRSWESGDPGHWRHTQVCLGRLGDGRWFVSRSGRRRSNTWVAHTERQAAEAVEAWMRRLGADWRETTGQDA